MVEVEVEDQGLPPVEVQVNCFPKGLSQLSQKLFFDTFNCVTRYLRAFVPLPSQKLNTFMSLHCCIFCIQSLIRNPIHFPNLLTQFQRYLEMCPQLSFFATATVPSCKTLSCLSPCVKLHSKPSKVSLFLMRLMYNFYSCCIRLCRRLWWSPRIQDLRDLHLVQHSNMGLDSNSLANHGCGGNLCGFSCLENHRQIDSL